MIDIKELMVGDWVDRSGTLPYYKVVGINSQTMEVLISQSGNDDETRRICWNDKLDPIPITPEILEKNWFKIAKWKEDEPAGLLGKWWDNRGQVLVKRFDFTLLGEVYSVKANNSRISNIRYVHELQHALRLCKIEKEITL